MPTKSLIFLLLLIVFLAGALYAVTNRAGQEGLSEEGIRPNPSEAETEAEAPTSFIWTFEDKGENPETLVPETRVLLVAASRTYDVGTYAGSCSDIAVSAWELMPGEIAGVICWWAGGGREVGIFEENGALVVKVGDIEEGTAEGGDFRGNFKTFLEL